MDERDKKIQELTREAAKWKKLALEAAERACFECEEYAEGKRGCKRCRIMKIKAAATA